MRLGILGAGSIARTMAETVNQMKEVELYAVASRSLERAVDFAKQFDVQKSYGDYEEMLQDEKVDLVYVATPHSHHFAHGMLCIKYGKPALIEKAFTRNYREARILIEEAEKRHVFLTEAIWTRYMPMRKVLDEIVASGMIGDIYSLTAQLSYPITHVERLMEPALAGGALLDIGIYPLNFMVMVFGEEILKKGAHAVLSDKGIDLANTIYVEYTDGKMAALHSDIRVAGTRQGTIYGKKGYIVVENINCCQGISVYNTEHKLMKRVEVESQITGYEYEVLACKKALEENRLECPEMTHRETLFMMRLMDEIRQEMGVFYKEDL